MLILLLLAAPVAVWGQFGYSTNADNTLTITGYTGPGGAVTIPTNISGLTVSSIGYHAFYENTNVTSITIPQSVTSIGAYALLLCLDLTTVTIPDSVTSIGEEAFDQCFRLTSIAIPGSVTNWGGVIFGECHSLTNVTIANGISSIVGGMFDGCTNLISITIPNSVTSIQDYGFAGCGFTSFVIPDSVASVGEEAFYGCALMTNVTIPGSVISIGQFAFIDCSNLSNLEIPGSVTSIGYDTFDSCGLTNISIPDNVTSMGDYAFSGCHSLINATVAKGVPIAYAMFSYCTNLTSVFVQGNAPTVVGDSSDAPVFVEDNHVTVYYLPGTMGWSNTYQGVPAVLWNPVIQTNGSSFGVRSNQFGFNITGTTNIPIVVEACTNLASPVWTPVTNVLLTNGSFHFNDPQWRNYPARFYGIGFP
jgi:hypothetical protein